MDLCGSSDSSLFVGGPVNIEGLQWLDGLGQEKEMADERGIDEVSSCPTIYEGGSGDGSRSIL